MTAKPQDEKAHQEYLDREKRCAVLSSVHPIVTQLFDDPLEVKLPVRVNAVFTSSPFTVGVSATGQPQQVLHQMSCVVRKAPKSGWLLLEQTDPSGAVRFSVHASNVVLVRFVGSEPEDSDDRETSLLVS